LKLKIEAKNGSVAWKSPSNIAIVKYWGKYGNQMPSNPSLSFTLSNSYTQTSVDFDVDPKRNGFEMTFSFEGKPAPKFENKIKGFFTKNAADFPYLNHLKLSISSSNSFPHSAGIASSASAMSALALCMVSIESRVFGGFADKKQFRTRASHLARLASGSAARSVYGGLVCWGESESVADSSNYYAVPIADGVHPVFATFQDAILIVDSSEKSVSSSVGHNLMVGHPYPAQDRDASEHVCSGEPLSQCLDGILYRKIESRNARRRLCHQRSRRSDRNLLLHRILLQRVLQTLCPRLPNTRPTRLSSVQFFGLI